MREVFQYAPPSIGPRGIRWKVRARRAELVCECSQGFCSVTREAEAGFVVTYQSCRCAPATRAALLGKSVEDDDGLSRPVDARCEIVA